MALFKPYKITSNQLVSLPIVDGQFIVASDTGQMWIDEGSERTEIPIHDSIDLSNYITETELTAALAEEASARQKQDNILQGEIEAKLSSSDLIQGENITIDYDEDSGQVTLSATDTNTTYSAMEGATSSAAGTTGLVPAPAAGEQTSFLRGDGIWATVTASVADKLATERTIALTGDITGSATFDGSADCSIATTLAANSVTANEIAAGAVGLSELSSAVGTIAVQSATPTDSHVKLWIKV